MASPTRSYSAQAGLAFKQGVESSILSAPIAHPIPTIVAFKAAGDRSGLRTGYTLVDDWYTPVSKRSKVFLAMACLFCALVFGIGPRVIHPLVAMHPLLAPPLTTLDYLFLDAFATFGVMASKGLPHPWFLRRIAAVLIGFAVLMGLLSVFFTRGLLG